LKVGDGLDATLMVCTDRCLKYNRKRWPKMKKWIPTFAVWFAIFVVSGGNAAATTYSAASYSDLTSVANAAASGDTIDITADIVVSAAVTLNKSLTITGNNHTVTVPVNGLNDAGILTHLHPTLACSVSPVQASW
jgi:hypothetical protein